MKKVAIIGDKLYGEEHVAFLHSLRNGDEGGLISVYRIYYKRLLFFAQKYVKDYQIAEEVVGDVFVKVWERRTSFSSLNRLRAFLYIATKNRCLNALRDTNAHGYIDDVADYEEHLYEDTDVFTKI